MDGYRCSIVNESNEVALDAGCFVVKRQIFDDIVVVVFVMTYCQVQQGYSEFG